MASFCIDIGSSGQQQFRHVFPAIGRRTAQGRIATVVFPQQQLGTVSEQCIDPPQIAIFDGIMKVVLRVACQKEFHHLLVALRPSCGQWL